MVPFAKFEFVTMISPLSRANVQRPLTLNVSTLVPTGEPSSVSVTVIVALPDTLAVGV